MAFVYLACAAVGDVAHAPAAASRPGAARGQGVRPLGATQSASKRACGIPSRYVPPALPRVASDALGCRSGGAI